MINESTRRKLQRALSTFKRSEKMYECGSPLWVIAEKIAKVVGEQNIIINVPYHGFRCVGSAKKIAEDVKYLTPFMGGKCWDVGSTTTLFYGTDKCQNGNYLPFQAEVDVFHVVSCKCHKANDTIVVDLEKGLSWRAYL